MTTWFTSDIHFGHENIIEYSERPFDGVPQMNAAIVSHWNQVVAPDDIVYIVGDLCMGKMDDSLPVVSQLQGRLRLIPGNHDRLHPMYRSKKHYDTWDGRYRDEAGIEVVKSVLCRIDVGHHRSVLFCHFPYAGDHTGETDRYVSERPPDKGEMLVHGHVHDAWRQKGRQINVGLDAWGGSLVDADLLEAMLDVGSFHSDRIAWPTNYG